MSSPNGSIADFVDPIVARLGGATKVGERIGTGQSNVSNWRKRGIPWKWHRILLREAEALDVSLSVEELERASRR